jgi:23S rRNA pseudouridine1911/1915/1917 synthase
LVEGHLQTAGQVGFCLTPSGPRGQSMRVAPPGLGQEARTMYTPVTLLPSRHTLLRLAITTGVRHQIRVHLAALGHPIVGDSRYGSRNEPLRLCLHAEALAFTSPATGQRITCTSPLPEDFAAVMERLRGKGRW